jgi:hypothetical protein
MVKAILSIVLLTASLGFGQPHNPGVDPAFLSKFFPLASFSAEDLPGALFLTYKDLPTNTFLAAWTNHIFPYQVFTNTGTTYPTNRAGKGVYFNGDPAQSFYSDNSGIRWSNRTDSMWISFEFPSNYGPRNADVILGEVGVGSREGFYASSYNSGEFFLRYHPGGAFGSPLTVGIPYDVAIVANAADWCPVYTNGVSAGVVPGQANTAGQMVYGIGKDVVDQQARMYVKFVLVCPNYVFTATDIANLHAYAASH